MTRVRSLGGSEEEFVVVIGSSVDLSVGFVVAGGWFGWVVVVGFDIAVAVVSIGGLSTGRIVICVGSIVCRLSPSILFESLLLVGSSLSASIIDRILGAWVLLVHQAKGKKGCGREKLKQNMRKLKKVHVPGKKPS